MTQHSRESLKRLIGLTHRKNSPFIKSIAVFTQDNQLFVTSNYHRDFTRLRLPDGSQIPELTSVTLYGDDIILRTPIQAETSMDGFPLPSDVEPPMIGYISMQLATDRAIVLQYRDAFFAVIIVLIGGSSFAARHRAETLRDRPLWQRQSSDRRLPSLGCALRSA